MSAWRSARLLGALALAAGCREPRRTLTPVGDDARPPAPRGAPVREGAVAAAEVLALPPPPAEVMQGQSRIINLLRLADGTTPAVDVWARRTADYAAVQLAHDVGYGATTPWFAVPDGSAAMVVAAGAGVDGRPYGGVMVKGRDDRQTGLLYLNAGKPTVAVLPEASARGGVAPPPSGQGQLLLVATALRDVAPDAGGAQFYVGDGLGGCRPVRDVPAGPPRVLGGATRLPLLVAPGPTRITLHRWPGDGCKLPAVFDTTVEVEAGRSAWVILHAPDGRTLRALTVEVGA